MGKPVTLEMVSPSDGETHLSDGQTTAIYNLFRTLNPKEDGTLDAKYLSKKLAADKGSTSAVLMGEVDAFIKDKDGDGKVTFGEFLEQFRMHEDPGDTDEINALTDEIKDLMSVISYE